MMFGEDLVDAPFAVPNSFFRFVVGTFHPVRKRVAAASPSTSLRAGRWTVQRAERPCPTPCPSVRRSSSTAMRFCAPHAEALLKTRAQWTVGFPLPAVAFYVRVYPLECCRQSNVPSLFVAVQFQARRDGYSLPVDALDIPLHRQD